MNLYVLMCHVVVLTRTWGPLTEDKPNGFGHVHLAVISAEMRLGALKLPRDKIFPL